MTYHKPVLLDESISGLNIQSGGTYVDVTFGGGGHSREILAQLGEGRLFGFDQDADAHANAPEDTRFTLIKQNFRHLKNYLRLYGIKAVNGILADLGVSSHQFDAAVRGFSIRFAGPLDMRMNSAQAVSARDIIMNYSEQDLKKVFQQYGELQNSGRLARRIVETRMSKPVDTTMDLISLAQDFTPPKKRSQFLAQLFQALRIEVNDEMAALREMLEQSRELLLPGGRLVVISYHSLEDRMVKHYMREGKFDGEADRDVYGNRLVPFRLITRKPIAPGTAETEMNSRARSARMRIAEKI